MVINTLKFKVITDLAKKTNRYDVATISEFLSKAMLPESHVCRANTTIRGCGKVTAWMIIRAYTEEIDRFPNAKKYAAFYGLVP